MHVPSTPPTLVLNGHPLSIRYKGVGAYLVRLIWALREYAPELSFKVLVPDFLREATQDLPADVLEIVSGRPPLRKRLASDIYWNIHLAGVARRKFPQAIYHSPVETWSLHHPRKLAVTLHDCIYRHYPRLQGGLVRKWWWKATEIYARRAGLVLTVSETSRDDLVRHCRIAPEKCRVLYSWVDRRFSPETAASAATAVREKYRLPGKFLLYLGGYNVNKNVEYLIEAYGLFRRHHLDAPPLVLAGNIPSDLSLAVCDVHGAIHRAALGPQAVVRPGYIEEQDLPGLYGAATAFLFPSAYEGFGYTPLEAMACGTPVMAADATSLREVVPAPENRFPLGEPEIFAEKIAALVATPEKFRHAMPAAFHAEVGIRRYLAILHEAFPPR